MKAKIIELRGTYYITITTNDGRKIPYTTTSREKVNVLIETFNVSRENVEWSR